MAGPPYIPCLPGNSAPAFIVVIADFMGICIAVIALRIYVRIKIVHAIGWDDFAMTAAFVRFSVHSLGFLHINRGSSVTKLNHHRQVLVLVDCITAWYSTALGIGHHLVCVDIANITEIRKLELADVILAVRSSTFARISVALLVVRLFAVSKTSKICLYGGTSFMVATGLAHFISMALHRTSIEKVTNALVPGTCWPAKKALISAYVQGGESYQRVPAYIPTKARVCACE